MERKKQLFFLLTIFFLAIFLRFFRITKVPPGLSWDEVGIGYNAYAIFTTGKDEFGSSYPFSFKSFDDYKSPLLVYLTAPFVGIFDLAEFWVRFPSALFGSLTVLLTYFLTKELFSNLKTKSTKYSILNSQYLPLTAMLLMAISPWHLQFSRAAFEPNLALFWLVLGTYLFLRGLNKPVYFLLSASSFICTLYSYQSPKAFLPLFFLWLAIIFRKNLTRKENLKWLLPSFFLAAVLLVPLVKTHFLGEAGSRLKSTAIFYQEGEKRPFDLVLLKEMAENYFSHFSPQFLFFGSEVNYRNKMREAGLFYWLEMPFLLLGLFYLMRQRKKVWSKMILGWIFLGAIPAAITHEAPHTLRTLNMLPALIIVISVGMQGFYTWSKKLSPKFRFIPCSLFLILYILNIAYYLYKYHKDYPVYAAKDWQYGYKQMTQYVKGKEGDQQVIVTTRYGQPHIFVQFFQKLEPLVIWGRGQYLFREINWEQDKNLSEVILVVTPEDTGDYQFSQTGIKIDKEIYFPDGEVAFRIIRL